MYIRITVFSFLFLLGFAHAQQNIRLMHYNLLNFGNPCGNVNVLDKYAWLEKILKEARPDVFTVNELNPNPIFSNGIISQSFSYTNAFEAASITNQANSNIVNQLFYNKDKVQLISQSVIPYSLRDINAYKLFVKGSGLNGNDSLFFVCIVGHFKAATGSSNEISRNVAATAVMDWINQNANGESVVVMGDFNIYGPSESAYKTLTNNPIASIRLHDVIQTTGWGGSGGASFYTQSTRTSSQDCGSTGGMDDRFDMMLMSDKLMDNTQELHYITDSYTAYGNDDNPYNAELTCVGNGEVSFDVCASLLLMSDHLPVVIELEAGSVVSRNKQLGIPGLEIQLAPQPASDIMFLKLATDNGRLESYTYTLTNLLGQEVLTATTDARVTEISVASLDKGFYFLKLQNEAGQFATRRVWVQ